MVSSKSFLTRKVRKDGGLIARDKIMPLLSTALHISIPCLADVEGTSSRQDTAIEKKPHEGHQGARPTSWRAHRPDQRRAIPCSRQAENADGPEPQDSCGRCRLEGRAGEGRTPHVEMVPITPSTDQCLSP